MKKEIVIKGAKENNLKNINLTLPKEEFIVFTGVSGSGKSTLAFDTIFAEGQRKFMESLSSYARMFIGQIQKPDVEQITGLSPSISIEQKTTNQNPRSTVGTVTEIYDYLRLLYASIGTPYCPNCKKPIKAMSVDQIIDKIKTNEIGSKIIVKAPIVRGQKGMHEKLLNSLKKSGYIRVEIDGITYTFDEEITLNKNIKHYISVVTDRIVLREDSDSRLSEAISQALNLTDGLVDVTINEKEENFSSKFACQDCGFSYQEISPRLFSFNFKHGACPDCEGLGFRSSIDVDKVIKGGEKSIKENALIIPGWSMDSVNYPYGVFVSLSKKYKFDLETPIKNLPKDIYDFLLYGNPDGTPEVVTVEYQTARNSGTYKMEFIGVINNFNKKIKATKSNYLKEEMSRYMLDEFCTTCQGKRLGKEALSVKVNNLSISDLCDKSVDEILEIVQNLVLSPTEEIITKDVLKEIKARLSFLKNVGLGYLTLSRTSGSLSGGEAQRIRLATQIGSGLTGVLYILDEPSIGLHQRDNEKLLASLKNLRDLGNTVIVVEHDEDTIREADYIVDIGPQAGVNGGEVVAQGKVEDLINCPNSITGKFLSGEMSIPIPNTRRDSNTPKIKIFGAKQNNLKNIDVEIPTSVFTCITGVSGSGKSSLINEILTPVLCNKLIPGTKQIEGKYDKIEIPEHLDKVICIDQSPIGRTPRSNPATYTGVFTNIRQIFAECPLSKERGYGSGTFSFNITGGRCEVCKGDGTKTIEMFFLPDVSVPCDVCGGKRYKRETLDVKFKGKTISDVLDMRIDEAYDFFENFNQVRTKLKALKDVGLGYIKLGQSSTDLSGGEAQRVKLATELCKKSTGKTVYILDEPTTGLHMYDVKKLINILQLLVSEGNTVIVIEHNLDVIKVCDHIIDLGPEGGYGGGTIIAQGTPEQLSKIEKSYTGQFLKKILNQKN
ncbi:MAG: excinuclease ABC subunit UvrA [Clostridia bacterium]|nr:excinuclease ABC subunit UvrA [Clostridia bacterium]